MNQKTRVAYLDVLRIAATIAVVILHVAAQNWNTSTVMQMPWVVFTIYDSCVRWAVPIFLMISGALFLNREISWERIYKKYIFRMLVAFGVWSTLYALVEWGGKELYM